MAVPVAVADSMGLIISKIFGAGRETSMCDLSELMLSIYLNFCSVGEKSLSNGSQMGHGAR